MIQMKGKLPTTIHELMTRQGLFFHLQHLFKTLFDKS